MHAEASSTSGSRPGPARHRAWSAGTARVPRRAGCRVRRRRGRARSPRPFGVRQRARDNSAARPRAPRVGGRHWINSPAKRRSSSRASATTSRGAQSLVHPQQHFLRAALPAAASSERRRAGRCGRAGRCVARARRDGREFPEQQVLANLKLAPSGRARGDQQPRTSDRRVGGIASRCSRFMSSWKRATRGRCQAPGSSSAAPWRACGPAAAPWRGDRSSVDSSQSSAVVL